MAGHDELDQALDATRARRGWPKPERCTICDEWADLNPGGVCDTCEDLLYDPQAYLTDGGDA